jgi:hypothetical protein
VLDPVRAGVADLVLGARALGGRHPLHATTGTRLLARYVAWRWDVPITDFGPLRAIRVGLLRSLALQDRASGWPVEMVVKAAMRGARVREVPVSHAPRLAGESKVSGTLLGSLRAAYGFLSAVLRAERHGRAALK